ncbi:hypothetical protein MHYP_G00219220 [Metynnis hypsauchen]
MPHSHSIHESRFTAPHRGNVGDEGDGGESCERKRKSVDSLQTWFKVTRVLSSHEMQELRCKKSTQQAKQMIPQIHRGARYIACASSDWEGIYSEDLVPWCKPLGNATLPEGCQKRTRELFFISEMVGFALLFLLVCLLGAYSFKNVDRDVTDGTPHTEQIEMQDLMQYHLRSLPVSQLLTLDHASSTDPSGHQDL